MKRFLMILITVVLLSGLIFVGCAESTQTPAPAAEPAATALELSLSYHYASKSAVAKQGLEPWAKMIEDESNGQVKIVLHGDATMVGQKDAYEAVETGLVDMVSFSPEALTGQFPLSEIITMPKLFPNAEVAGQVHHEIMNKYLLNTEYKNVKLLLVLPLPPLQLFSTKQVHKIEDLKGMKIRSQGKLDDWMNDAFGATGVYMPPSEIYTSLERGLIDGIFFVYEGAFAFGFHEITPYKTECNIYSRAFPVVMNLNTWNSLSPDLKAIFEKNSTPEISAHYGNMIDQANQYIKHALTGFAKKAGQEGIYVLPKEEDARWVATLNPVIEKWVSEMDAKGLPVRPMLEDTRTLV
ncbi:TRAP transporter substrate-binding protein, partial [Chloroflexota bacterium]